MEQRTNAGTTYFYLADGLGSVLKTTDASGNVVDSYSYDVYGKTTSNSGSQVNDRQFAGEETDATGLQYLRARYSDPATGTFLSRDPLAASPTYTGSPFGYASGNPSSASDPMGLKTEWNDALQKWWDDSNGAVWDDGIGWHNDVTGLLWSEDEGWHSASPAGHAATALAVDPSWLRGGIGPGTPEADYNLGDLANDLNGWSIGMGGVAVASFAGAVAAPQGAEVFAPLAAWSGTASNILGAASVAATCAHSGLSSGCGTGLITLAGTVYLSYFLTPAAPDFPLAHAVVRSRLGASVASLGVSVGGALAGFAFGD